MLRLFNQLKNAPLIRRVTLLTLLFGLVLSTALQSMLAVIDFEQQKQALNSCVKDEVDREYASLTEAIWLREQVDVMRVLDQFELNCAPGMDPYATFLWQIDLRDQEKWLERGGNLKKKPLDVTEIPISYWREETDGYGIGEMRVSVSFHEFYQAAISGFWFAMGWHLLVLLSCTAFGLLLGYNWFVARSREYVEGIERFSTEEMMQRSAEEEPTELSALWKVMLRIKSDSENKLFELKQALETTQQERDRARKDVESKNQFISSLSHDLRTPMNGLIGFSALLSESELNETQKEYASTIRASLESLLHVINDVLDLSRVETGDLHVNSIPFSLRGVVSGVISLLRFRAQSKGIELETRVSTDIPVFLRGDPARIRQLLTNLVSNAIKYTEKGYILIDLELITGAKDECTIRVAIEDTGLSIEQRGQSTEQLEQLGISQFSNELRVKRSISIDASEKLAQLMGTQLHAQNADTMGATYWFDLHLPQVKGIENGLTLDRSALSQVFVLVVDVVELSRSITMELLQGWGIAFEPVDDLNELREVIDLYQGSEYLMVLLDDRVDAGDSYAAVNSITSLLADKGAVIVLSGYPQLGDAERFFLAGAAGFLSKQDRDPSLRDVICQVYSERESNVGRDRRLVTRYTVQDLMDSPSEVIPVWNVLIVEENIVNQQLIARALEQNDCRVDIATNGFEAIELFKSGNYDLILMDCEMSDMDGYETSQILCEIELSKKRPAHTPIIALLESSLESDSERCFKVGMDDVLPKPIKLSALKMVLQKHLG